jgi:hypothetical protein
MNHQQVIDLLKGLCISGGPLAVLLAVVVGGSQRADEIAAAIGGVISVGGVIWTWYDARRAATVTKAAAIEGVQVHVNTAVAPADVTAVAVKQATSDSDPVSDVVPMHGGPRTDGKIESGPSGQSLKQN